MAGLPLMGGVIVTEAMLLIALALGYMVCYFASQEEKQLKSIGTIIGVFIIVLSFILILGNLFLNTNVCLRYNKMGYPHMMQQRHMPGETFQMPLPPPPQPQSMKK